MITQKHIKNGISKGIIRFIVDPNMGSGTVCAIGDSWFYFGGLTAEEENPEEYLKHVPINDIINSICEVLDDFKNDEDFADEYCYYKSILQEQMKK